MNQWLIRLAIVGALLISATSVLLALVVWLSVNNGRISSGTGGSFDFASVIYALVALLTAVVSALILWSRPQNRVGWTTLALAFGLGLTGLTQAYAILGASRMLNPLVGVEWVALVSQSAWALVFLPAILLLLLFPSGHFLSRRWRWVARCAVVVVVSGSLLLLLANPIEIGGIRVANPLGGFSEETILPLASGGFVLILVLLTVSLIGIFLRYRRAQESERQQIKWLIYAAALFITAMSLGFFLPTGSLAAVLINLTALGIPIAIGVAILRYRLYNIDILIRRTLIYSIITAMLALFYFGAVVVLQQVFRIMIGAGDDLAIIISTLAIAALFNPLRHRVQDAIDHRFYRRKYDAQKVLERFAATVRDEVELEKLTGELLNVVNETMQPTSVSLWLRKTTDGRQLTTEK
jgi:hypothetical protein